MKGSARLSHPPATTGPDLQSGAAEDWTIIGNVVSRPSPSVSLACHKRAARVGECQRTAEHDAPPTGYTKPSAKLERRSGLTA